MVTGFYLYPFLFFVVLVPFVQRFLFFWRGRDLVRCFIDGFEDGKGIEFAQENGLKEEDFHII